MVNMIENKTFLTKNDDDEFALSESAFYIKSFHVNTKIISNEKFIMKNVMEQTVEDTGSFASNKRI